MLTIIISRYNENIDWVNNITKNKMIEEIIIFNKGEDNICITNEKIKIIKMKNTGREGGTYLDYIIDNYDKMPENIIFTQANPFEHNKHFLDFLNDDAIPLYIDKNILSLTTHYNNMIPPNHFVTCNNSYNINNLKLIKYFVRDYDLQIIGHSSFNDKGINKLYGLFKRRYKSYHIFKTICKFIDIEVPEKYIPIALCGCFFVKSKQILRHPIEVYIKLRDFLYNTNEQGGPEGYILERLWYYLFTGESYNTITKCVKELFVDIEPTIRIYCKKRNIVYLKNIKDCREIVENTNTYIIYTKNGEQKILPGVDFIGKYNSISRCDSINSAKIVGVLSNIKFYFYIKGHIRNSFKTTRLKEMVESLKVAFPNIIFVMQTWSRQECKKHESWKHIDENNNIVSKSTIADYFKNKHISDNCLIIDESTIQYNGVTEGKLCKSGAPLKGWKNMWYGIFKGIEHLHDDDEKNIVLFRYDYFDIVQSKRVNERKILNFIHNKLHNSNNDTISFIQGRVHGVDNLFMGKLNKIKQLINKFYFNLDDICRMYPNTGHQEYLVYDEAQLM